MSAKHTPSPWSFFQERHPDMAINQWWIDGGNRKALALLQVMDLNHSKAYREEHPAQVNEWHATLEEVEANARLIAAAPELLEALEELTRFHELGYSNTKTLEMIVSQARTAIAKAKGA